MKISYSWSGRKEEKERNNHKFYLEQKKTTTKETKKTKKKTKKMILISQPRWSKWAPHVAIYGGLRIQNDNGLVW